MDAIQIGNLLAQAKETIGRGNFAKFLQTHVRFSIRTAQNYLALARKAKDGKVAVLTLTAA